MSGSMRKAAGDARAYVCVYFKVLGQDFRGGSGRGGGILFEQGPAYMPSLEIVTFRI
jgi:hypothetical protein